MGLALIVPMILSTCREGAQIAFWHGLSTQCAVKDRWWVGRCKGLVPMCGAGLMVQLVAFGEGQVS